MLDLRLHRFISPAVLVPESARISDACAAWASRVVIPGKQTVPGIFSLRAEKKAVAENVQAGMEAAPPTVGTSDFAADRASPRCFASHRTKSEISVLDIQCGRVAGRVING